jgi:hypothetical protein
MIFSYARGPFLEFLRNLTPQIMLFSIAIVMSTKLDTNKFDLSNTRSRLWLSTKRWFSVLSPSAPKSRHAWPV